MEVLRKLFSSQKFIVLLVSVIGVLITKIFKVQVDPATITEFVILIGGYLVGQGIADQGKSAAKVVAVSNVVNSDAVALLTTEKIDAIKSV